MSKDLVFGIRAVIETIRAGKEIDKLLIQRDLSTAGNLAELLQAAHEFNVPISRVPKERLDRVTRKNHQGVIAFVSAVNYAKLHNVISDVYERGLVPLILILDRVTDVRNFGAIARTAECAGAHAIVIPAKGAAQINADAVKTSSGALNFIPVCREESLVRTVSFLQESGLQVIGCTEKAEKLLYESDLTVPTAIIMGSEEDGITNELIRKVDALVKIPEAGQISSLNVSVAAGVMIYEAIRQRLR
ncbi:23S rRNA (guanosine(2251)-2'-O)-methyltransferase RlmB [Cytophagaceae bacterium DM2B3-1]|uniref:23S rRNA (Guanosine(2251)-2'-O)-methyltransferase RlmB n=1 Tax=Xanthocytophaga flava TaxID=3048013 RepID=A0ABT7CD42_9BACT|nr:23S rRNA (guanosine(2251)-2'-O)-methyltransferase RlmB [Xanthocytophaga flavus]MDJ1470532.1 23S rRNA (guanosine(2251)-2'-O)-methyltransferase RlmB [Xanthocytophaga flavus]MDJ1491625.1 23S rRNA (guanosine(2251)-2'-O)-methyltransferase RlmB [Xanthocytophaga flavus]